MLFICFPFPDYLWFFQVETFQAQNILACPPPWKVPLKSDPHGFQKILFSIFDLHSIKGQSQCSTWTNLGVADYHTLAAQTKCPEIHATWHRTYQTEISWNGHIRDDYGITFSLHFIYASAVQKNLSNYGLAVLLSVFAWHAAKTKQREAT